MSKLFCLEVAFQVNTSAGYLFFEGLHLPSDVSFRLFSRTETDSCFLNACPANASATIPIDSMFLVA